jgi:pyrroline-5-carboxylate reductase
MPSPLFSSLLLIGCGKMGAALATGWLQANSIGERLWIADPAPLPAALAADARVLLWTGDAAPDAVVLAIKPQQFAAVLPAYRGHLGQRPLVVSIAAGVTLAHIADLLAYDGPIVRAMPNTPAAIGQGITALVANDAIRAAECAQAEQLMAATGATLWLQDEEQMHAVTALSGSGPAYVFAFIEALTAAGVALGLPQAMAAHLARATVTGSAALAASSAESPATLRQNVTSPGGTTAAGLAVLQATLPDLLRTTTHAAANRSRELAQA